MYFNLLDLDDFFILLMMRFLSFPNIVLYIVRSLSVFCSFVLWIMKAVDIISSQATVPLTLLRGKIILNSFWSWVLCGYEGSDKFISLNECLHVWSRSCVFHQSCCPAVYLAENSSLTCQVNTGRSRLRWISFEYLFLVSVWKFDALVINTAENPFGSYLEEALNVYVKSAGSFALLFEWIFYISAKKIYWCR